MDDENRKVLVKNPGRVALVLAGAGLVVALVVAVVLAIALQPSQSLAECLAVHGFEPNPASDSALYAAAVEHCGG